MRTIISTFNKRSLQKYRDIGFVRTKYGFARRYYDVLQIFACVPKRTTSTCTVHFDLLPLSMGISEIGEGLYDLCKLTPEYLSCADGWKYNQFSISSINDCIDQMFGAIDNHLIPLFQKCNNCQTALSELLIIEELVDARRIEWLALHNESDKARPWRERSMFDPRKYYMALKANDRDYAISFLTLNIKFYEAKLTDIASASVRNRPPVVQERYQAMHRQYTEHLKYLLESNQEFLEDLLARNEEHSLKIIKELVRFH